MHSLYFTVCHMFRNWGNYLSELLSRNLLNRNNLHSLYDTVCHVFRLGNYMQELY